MHLIRALGGLIASTDELMKVVASVDYGDVFPDILKKETLDLMYTPSEAYNRYALGWRVNYPYYPDWSSYHGGTLAGTGTLMARDKSRDAASVVLCNSRSYLEGFDDSMYDLLDMVMDQF
jgi:CubicO group peptidase (beta-lactamase class C family)